MYTIVLRILHTIDRPQHLQQVTTVQQVVVSIILVVLVAVKCTLVEIYRVITIQ